MKDFEQRVLERMPSAEEERLSLGRVWNQVGQAVGQIPDEVLRSVQQRSPSRHQRARTFLPRVAAVLVVGAAIGVAIAWPRGVRVYAAGNDGLQVTLADDSNVEMRAHSEMTVDRASDGIQIELRKGDIIVNAAKRRAGHLYVQTGDMTVDGIGTVFLVNAGTDGSRVGVIEGEVRVREGGTPLRRSGRHSDGERRLQPGEQFATSPVLAARPVRDDILWSRNAVAHLAQLDSFMKAMTRTSGALAPVATPRQGAAVAGQTATTEFEEASIRECDPDNLPAAVPGSRGGGGANSVYMTPGRLYVLCMTPAALVRSAYGYRSVTQEVELGSLVNPEAPERREPIAAGVVYGEPPEDGQRVRGGPDWVRTERYTIEAVAEGLDPTNDACIAGSRAGRPSSPNGPCRTVNAASMSGPMLRALLERRFKLKAHIETEQVPALALVVAPGGLKIKPAASDSCTPANQLGGPAVPPGRSGSGLLPNFPERPTLSDVRRGQKPLCGQVLERNGPNQVIVAGGSTFSALAQALGRRREFVGPVRVYDKTGITDTFDWILEFAPEEGRGPSSPSEPTNVPPGPRIFDALQQQLGLRLEPAQAPREFIVIDHVERPGPN